MVLYQSVDLVVLSLLDCMYLSFPPEVLLLSQHVHLLLILGLNFYSNSDRHTVMAPKMRF